MRDFEPRKPIVAVACKERLRTSVISVLYRRGSVRLVKIAHFRGRRRNKCARPTAPSP